jgi:hypothetical protein
MLRTIDTTPTKAKGRRIIATALPLVVKPDDKLRTIMKTLPPRCRTLITVDEESQPIPRGIYF